MNDKDFIQKTFELAIKGKGPNWPNPLVGAVVVKNGKIIGEGYHRKYGSHHAEVEAIQSCTESPEGSTIYVNLEPCCHTNKQTPPCTHLLIKEKIKRVVICNQDPNPAVNGKGVEFLRSNGIEVECGVLEEEGEKLNEVFFHAQRNKKPFIHLKLASTLDGKIALPNGESKWITGSTARSHVHRLRSEHQAIMVGAETIRKDNPTLNVRLDQYSGEQPYRIIFTQSGKLPENSTIFSDNFRERTLIFSQVKANFPLPEKNIIYIHQLDEAMDYLFEKKIINLFLEGGPSLASAFMRNNMVQRLSLFMNPSLLGCGKTTLEDFGVTELGARPKLKEIETQWLNGDLLISGRLF